MSHTISEEFSREVQTAERLAREAGSLTLRYRDGDLRVELKAGDEPVTIADHKSSDLIVAGLREAFPDDVVISEENADDSSRLTAARVWYVDPIDGTKDYIRGEDGFSVMIGLAIDHRPAVGVIYQPMGNRMYMAAPGAGCWLQDDEAELVRVNTSNITNVADIRIVISKSHRSPTIDKVKSTLGIQDEMNVGSVGLKLGLIARGIRDLYVNPSSKTSSWDTCAPEALLQEAGGNVTDIHGDPLRYDAKITKHQRGLLASNGHVHRATVERLAQLFPREQALD